MTNERLAVSGIAALITVAACAALTVARSTWQVGLCGLVATLALATFAITLGDE